MCARPRAASDWFKDFQTGARDIGIVLSGVPRLKRLLDCNEQLRNRAHKPLYLMPYRYDEPDQRNAFAGCVAAFLEEFHSGGWVLQMTMNEFVRHTYVASAGHIGLLARFFSELSDQIEPDRPITREQCAAAFHDLNAPGDGHVKPFGSHAPNDIDLMSVLASELDRYDLPLPPSSISAELAQAKLSASKESNQCHT